MTTPESQPEVQAKPWFIKPKRTPEEIDRDGRSPNRKKRGKRVSTTIDAEQRQQRVLNGLAVGKSRGEASLMAGTRWKYAQQVMDRNPAFEAKAKAAEEEYRRNEEECRRKAAGVIDESLELSATEYVRLGLHAKSEKVRAGVLGAELRGRGVLTENPVVAIDQSHRTIKLVIEREGKIVKEIEAEIGKRS